MGAARGPARRCRVLVRESGRPRRLADEILTARDRRAEGGWTAAGFVPNAQFYGVVVNVFSLAAKTPPRLTAPAWATTITALAAGAVPGRLLAARTSEWLALAGGTTTLTKGLWTL
ncbi:hypothetical protein [Embleya sp. NPDC020630]|uniref:hypothetical protein n=1 Tax=Embleya sp. NPDC020630 TaxID=3363979 RepID=UPI00378DDB44